MPGATGSAALWTATQGGLLSDLPRAPIDPTVVKGAQAEIQEGIREGLGRHRDVMVRVLRDLDAREDGLGLGPLTSTLAAVPASKRDDPRWYLVDLAFVRKLSRTIGLAELKDRPELAGMILTRRGNRLSVMPVERAHYDFILSLE